MPSDKAAVLFLESTLFRFRSVKELAEKAMEQIPDAELSWQPDKDANSIAVIIQHLHGNMMSRWTDFLSSDGEKEFRNRDGEFIQPGKTDRKELLSKWEEGWACLFHAIESLKPEDLIKSVVIRGEFLNVIDAIQRQVAHVSYHVGQIVYIARERKGTDFKSLSIPRGKSGK